MFNYKYPVRLLIVCPTCKGQAIVLRDDWMRAQTFCPRDGVPMTVLTVAAGAPLSIGVPLVGDGAGEPLDLTRCVKPEAVLLPPCKRGLLVVGGGIGQLGRFRLR